MKEGFIFRHFSLNRVLAPAGFAEGMPAYKVGGEVLGGALGSKKHGKEISVVG
jgi:hypothetical protein